MPVLVLFLRQDCFPVLFISSYTEANMFIISDLFPFLDGAFSVNRWDQQYVHMQLIGSSPARLWNTDTLGGC